MKQVMFRRGLLTYNILLKENPASLEDFNLLKEGFSFWAFFFTPVWLVYRRQWRILFLALALAFLVMRLEEHEVLNPLQAQILSIGFQFWVGLSAVEWRLRSLLKKGRFILKGVVVAPDEVSAIQRAFDAGLIDAAMFLKQPSAHDDAVNEDAYLRGSAGA